MLTEDSASSEKSAEWEEQAVCILPWQWYCGPALNLMLAGAALEFVILVYMCFN